MTQMVEPYLIPANEAARRLRRHPATLRAALSEGTIPGVRIGKRWFINSEVLKDVLDGRYNTPQI